MDTGLCKQQIYTTVKWPLENFDQKYANLVVGDQWPSDVYAIYLEEHGWLPLDFTFWPPGADPVWSMEGHLRMQITTPNNEVVRTNVRASIENADGSKRVAFKTAQAETNFDWAGQTTKEVIDRFADEKTVYLVMHIPREVRRESVSGDVVHAQRFEIQRAANTIRKAPLDQRWVAPAQPLFADRPAGPKVALVFEPKKQEDDGYTYCNIRLQVASFADFADLTLRMVLWLERGDGKRQLKYDDWTNFTPNNVEYGLNTYISVKELLEWAGRGSIFVCCDVHKLEKVDDQPTLVHSVCHRQPHAPANNGNFDQADDQRMDVGDAANTSVYERVVGSLGAITVETCPELLVAAVRAKNEKVAKLALDFADANVKGGKAGLLITPPIKPLVREDLDLFMEITEVVDK